MPEIINEAKIKHFLNEGESQVLEFKHCTNQLSNSVFETVCSFSNRYGGFLILGIEEVNGLNKVVGLNKNSVPDIKKNFINLLKNPNKINPPLFLELHEIEYEEKTLLWAYIPQSSEVEFCNGKIFDRNGDADQDITKSVALVENLFNRKSRLFYERQIFPYMTLKHLRLDLIEKVKQLIAIKNQIHPWLEMDTMTFFKSASLFEENLITGEKGFNLAALLLFGKDEVIHSALPAYKTDAIFRSQNQDRYDDRLVVDTNLIESYEQLMAFTAKHTDDKFFLINNASMSVRDAIARELISNVLVHREYSSSFPAKLIISKEKIYTENWNKSYTFGKLTPETFMPYPKNPIIAKFFMQINRADSLGSGVRNLYRYAKIYSNSEPDLEEGDIFKATVPLVEPAEENKVQATIVSSKAYKSNEQKALEFIQANQKTTSQEIATYLGFKSKTSAQKLLSNLISENRIKKVGNGKNSVYINM